MKMILLLSCWILTGIMAEDAAVTNYKMRNSSICLNVTKPPPYNGGSWTFAGKFIASREHMNPSFAKKVEFNPENLMLCIKELTDQDTGIYEATIYDHNFSRSTEKYRVIVQDSVPRPVLRLSVLRSNLSAGLCSIAVNCSVQDEWASANCSEAGCRASQRSLPEVVSIRISINNWTVVCSANNQVSAKNESEDMEAACFSEPEHTEASLPAVTIVILFAVCASLIALITLLAHKVSSECNHPQRQTLVEEQPQPETRGSSSSSEVAYENMDEETGPEPRQEVETVYSVVQAASVTPPPPPVESETSGEASHSLTSTEGGGAWPAEVNTVYSVLQRPKP